MKKIIILLVLFGGLLAGCDGRPNDAWREYYKDIDYREGYTAGYDESKTELEEKYLKAELITPTAGWLDLHGDGMDSWKVFNTKIALENIKDLKGQKNGI